MKNITTKTALTAAVKAIENSTIEDKEDILAKLSKMIITVDKRANAKKKDYTKEIEQVTSILAEASEPISATDIANSMGLSASKIVAIINQANKEEKIINRVTVKSRNFYTIV